MSGGQVRQMAYDECHPEIRRVCGADEASFELAAAGTLVAVGRGLAPEGHLEEPTTAGCLVDGSETEWKKQRESMSHGAFGWAPWGYDRGTQHWRLEWNTAVGA